MLPAIAHAKMLSHLRTDGEILPLVGLSGGSTVPHELGSWLVELAWPLLQTMTGTA